MSDKFKEENISPYNASGNKDLTAYYAVKNICNEDKKSNPQNRNECKNANKTVKKH